MKKVINFLKKEKVNKNLRILWMLSLIVSFSISIYGIVLMKSKFVGSLLDQISFYFFIPTILLALFFFFLIVPYVWYIKKDEGILFKGVMIFLSIVPGVFIWSLIRNILDVELGLWNIPIGLLFGVIYLQLMSVFFGKYFKVFNKMFSE